MLDDIGGQRRIGHVAELTGLTTSALRAWDRRYGLGPTTRTPGGQRLYSDADVERIRTVQRMVRDGWPVDSAAHHVMAAGRPGEGGRADPGAHAPPPGAPGEGDHDRPAFVPRLLEDIADVDLYATFVAYKAARDLLRANGAEEVYQVVAWLSRRLEAVRPDPDRPAGDAGHAGDAGDAGDAQ